MSDLTHDDRTALQELLEQWIDAEDQKHTLALDQLALALDLTDAQKQHLSAYSAPVGSYLVRWNPAQEKLQATLYQPLLPTTQHPLPSANAMESLCRMRIEVERRAVDLEKQGWTTYEASLDRIAALADSEFYGDSQQRTLHMMLQRDGTAWSLQALMEGEPVYSKFNYESIHIKTPREILQLAQAQCPHLFEVSLSTPTPSEPMEPPPVPFGPPPALNEPEPATREAPPLPNTPIPHLPPPGVPNGPALRALHCQNNSGVNEWREAYRTVKRNLSPSIPWDETVLREMQADAIRKKWKVSDTDREDLYLYLNLANEDCPFDLLELVVSLCADGWELQMLVDNVLEYAARFAEIPETPSTFWAMQLAHELVDKRKATPSSTQPFLDAVPPRPLSCTIPPCPISEALHAKGWQGVGYDSATHTDPQGQTYRIVVDPDKDNGGYTYKVSNGKPHALLRCERIVSLDALPTPGEALHIGHTHPTSAQEVH